jgi:hypothetical protein
MPPRPLILLALLPLALVAAGAAPLRAQDEQPAPAQSAAKDGKGAGSAQSGETEAQHLTEEFLRAYRAGDHETALRKLEQLRALVRRQQAAKAPANAEPAEGAPFQVQKSPVPLMVEGRKLLVHFGSNRVYGVKADPELSRLLNWKYRAAGALQLAVEDGGRLAIQNRFVKVGGATRTIRYASSNESVLRIDEKGQLTIEGPGRADLTVSVDEASMRIPFQVVAVPLQTGLAKEKVIEALGLPDHQAKQYIRWLDSAFIDGIFYYANTKDGLGLSVEHWQYDKYPGVVLRFDGLDRLQDCAQPEWAQFELTVYKLEHH